MLPGVRRLTLARIALGLSLLLLESRERAFLTISIILAVALVLCLTGTVSVRSCGYDGPTTEWTAREPS